MKVDYKKTILLSVVFSCSMMLINFFLLKTQMQSIANSGLQSFEVTQYAVFTVFGGPIDPQIINITQMAVYMIFPIFMLVNIYYLITQGVNKTSLLVLVRKRSAVRYVLYIEKHIALHMVLTVLIYLFINTLPLLRYTTLFVLFPFLSVVGLLYLLQYFCLSNILVLISLLFSNLYTIIIYVFTLLFELSYIYFIAESSSENQIRTSTSFIVKFFIHAKVFVNYYDMPFNNWRTLTILGNMFWFNLLYLFIITGCIITFIVAVIKAKHASIYKGSAVLQQ